MLPIVDLLDSWHSSIPSEIVIKDHVRPLVVQMDLVNDEGHAVSAGHADCGEAKEDREDLRN